MSRKKSETWSPTSFEQKKVGDLVFDKSYDKSYDKIDLMEFGLLGSISSFVIELIGMYVRFVIIG